MPTGCLMLTGISAHSPAQDSGPQGGLISPNFKASNESWWSLCLSHGCRQGVFPGPKLSLLPPYDRHSLSAPASSPSFSLWFGWYSQQWFVSSVALAPASLPYHGYCSHQALWPWNPVPTTFSLCPSRSVVTRILISGLAFCPPLYMGSTRVKYR